MNMMGKMMEKMMGGMSPEKKKKMMHDMMPKMMEDMRPEDMMKMMHEFMPKMMENCMSSMSKEERKEMLNFCSTMIEEMKEKFIDE